MSATNRQRILALIVATCAYYNQKPEDAALSMYAEDLEDLPFEAVAQALKEVRRDPKTTRFPLPAVIRDRIRPVETDENLAVLAVNRVIDAVAKYGWANPDQAKEFVGEIGWEVVQADGGWKTVCESLTQENLNTTRAQWRTLALSIMKSAKAGTLKQAPELPRPSIALITLTQSAFKPIPSDNG